MYCRMLEPCTYFLVVNKLHCIYWVEPKNACYFILAPRPECTTDPECPEHLACIREKCQDPCQTHSCGVNAECKVKRHRAFCVCLIGYEGDPYTICEERKHVEFSSIFCAFSAYFFFSLL